MHKTVIIRNWNADAHMGIRKSNLVLPMLQLIERARVAVHLVPVGTPIWLTIIRTTKMEGLMVNTVDDRYYVPRPHRCQKCGKCYMNDRTLKEHLKNVCGKKHGFGCDHCQYTAYQKVNVQTHIERKHKGMEVVVNTIAQDDSR